MKERREPDISSSGTEHNGDPASALTQVVQQLRAAYQDLQKKSEDLNRELGQINLKLRQSLAEKDKMSAYLGSILESLNQGIVAVDLQGRIAAFNRAAEEILEEKAEKVMGRSYEDVLGRGIQEKHALPYLMESGQTCSSEKKEIQTKTGEKVTVSFSAYPLKDTDGKLFGAMELFSRLDESKQKGEENRRQETLAALGEMTAVVAHEIKNPLGGIRGFAELLDRDLEEGDPRKRLVRKIIEGVDALTRIVATLLDEAKPVKLNLRKVEMSGFTDDAIKFFEMDSSNKKSHIRMIKVYPQGKLHCNLDTEKFRQTMLNLLRNAVQAMPKGGKIKVELNRTADQQVILTISDTGIGISPETKEKIFTPFFTTKEGGTGLGLFTVKKTVEAHGGRIRLDSQAGSGTTVTVALPTIT